MPAGFDRTAATTLSFPPGTAYAQMPWAINGRLSAEHMNRLLVDLANYGMYGGNGFGIFDGFNVAAGAGLDVTVSAGHGMGPGPIYLPDTAHGSLPNNTTVYLWLVLAPGAFPDSAIVSHGTNPAAPPAGTIFHLATLTTAGGIVTAIDGSGVPYLRGGFVVRTTFDRGAPLDTPPVPIRTITQAGMYDWHAGAHRPLGNPVFQGSFGAHVQLVAADAPTQVLTPTGAGLHVSLPVSPIYGTPPLVIVNGAPTGGNSFDLKVGSTVVATLAPGMSAGPIVTVPDTTGHAAYSSSTITPNSF
ncbi:hypothetical protein OP10G_0174 [Fimbriimonas ginsengisoli Gsoil 348]|uniref:Uncharacterized protein n=2 Tax=Fimbriimonas ginsengisoli TaxID=1005039 RepID=A0A068NJE0_FIMGI|nr:hypothetical protein OP10G_0174 [Fimbriimonas ginsengisoli Gsoil 348]